MNPSRREDYIVLDTSRGEVELSPEEAESAALKILNLVQDIRITRLRDAIARDAEQSAVPEFIPFG